jgi:hypothetical protein
MLRDISTDLLPQAQKNQIASQMRKESHNDKMKVRQ